MPVQQITVVPARDNGSTGKSSSRPKDKSEGKKAPGRSGSRSSNISKVSNSTGLTTASRTSVTPSSQDICSSAPLSRLEEDESEAQNSEKHTSSSTMTVANAPVSPCTAPPPKKQVKRRHRRKAPTCPSLTCVEHTSNQDLTERSLSSDRSDRGEKRERPAKTRKDLAPRLRCSGAPETDSTSDEDAWRQARSWSKEKARRARRRSRERDAVQTFENKVEEMELQSISSEEEKENKEEMKEESSGGLKRRHGSKASVKQDISRDEASEVRETTVSKDHEEKSNTSTPSTEEEGPEELITKRYQERGAGGGDMSVPVPQAHCTGNGVTMLHPCSDSETEVCRICHCEGDDDCPLIMPCRCTGSLSFVHQTCLNQWIKSSDTRCCELCKFDFIMETRLKPLRKWEKLHMSKSERRKIFCSVLFHLIAIGCMLWSVYILVKRTAEEVRIGKNGVLEWPFWTKLIVVAIGFTGGLIFMYIQSKVYLQLWHRLKAFNRIITVQNCPDKELHNPQARRSHHSTHSVEVPVSPEPVSSAPVSPAPVIPVPVPTQDHPDSDMSVEAAVAPAHSPV
ncbi:uncharacterized protein marchf1 isoform X2 [Boleophthalmus pectinirostris]|uniref:uncharacterized protein marchf1 isoform X2 n=1 Tax=Boleophthalmus pectinirostris TaxID=150288 RepID=UPI00242B73AC|nr:uncharacterized protein marchf1 isoform X2 [Boleophthalmus pectinirostris]